MRREYIPLFLDFNEATQDLSDDECGRLVRAIVDYANGLGYEQRLTGAEKIAFRFLKGAIDRNAAISEKRAIAGSSKQEQTETNENKTEQTKTNSLTKNNNKKQEQITKTNNEVCSEASQPSEPAVPAEPPVYLIPLIDKTMHPVTQTDIDHYKELYPAVNVDQEMRKICGWCESNPTRRKTARGVAKFVNGWLSREQDRGGSNARPQTVTYVKPKKDDYEQRPNTEQGLDDVPQWLRDYQAAHTSAV